MAQGVAPTNAIAIPYPEGILYRSKNGVQSQLSGTQFVLLPTGSPYTTTSTIGTAYSVLYSNSSGASLYGSGIPYSLPFGVGTTAVSANGLSWGGTWNQAFAPGGLYRIRAGGVHTTSGTATWTVTPALIAGSGNLTTIGTVTTAAIPASTALAWEIETYYQVSNFGPGAAVGSGAAASYTVTNGAITGITITNGGSGYTTNPDITTTGFLPAPILSPVVVNGVLTGITIESPGAGGSNGFFTITAKGGTVSTWGTVSLVTAATTAASIYRIPFTSSSALDTTASYLFDTRVTPGTATSALTTNYAIIETLN